MFGIRKSLSNAGHDDNGGHEYGIVEIVNTDENRNIVRIRAGGHERNAHKRSIVVPIPDTIVTPKGRG